MSKAYAEAHAPLGENELLDEIMAAKPGTDHTKYRLAEALRDNGLQHLHDAVALLESRAQPYERGGQHRDRTHGRGARWPWLRLVIGLAPG